VNPDAAIDFYGLSVPNLEAWIAKLRAERGDRAD
jgi:hypothetical protein